MGLKHKKEPLSKWTNCSVKIPSFHVSLGVKCKYKYSGNVKYLYLYQGCISNTSRSI